MKIFDVRLGGKKGNISFYKGVCVKAKLTFGNFFPFFAPFPKVVNLSRGNKKSESLLNFVHHCGLTVLHAQVQSDN